VEEAIAGAATEGDVSKTVFWLALWVGSWAGAIWLVFRGIRRPELAARYRRWAWRLVFATVTLTLVSVALLVMGLWRALESPTLTEAEREALITGGWQAAILTGLLSFAMLVFAPLSAAVGLTIVAKRVERVHASLQHGAPPPE